MAETKSGGKSKPGTSAATRKSTKSGSAASKKPAKSATTTSKKPAKSATTAAKKPASAGAAAKKPGKAAESRVPKTATDAKSAAKKPAGSRTPSKRTVVADTARSYFDALAARDASAAAALWHKDGVEDLVPLGIFRGPDAIRRLLTEMFTAMPDMRFSVERITADDSVAAVQWRATGTFSAGSFQGLEPTGRRVELRGTDCLEIDEGKIIRNTAIFDGAAFARQVGLLPAEDSGADRAIRAGFNTVTKLRRSVAKRTAG